MKKKIMTAILVRVLLMANVLDVMAQSNLQVNAGEIHAEAEFADEGTDGFGVEGNDGSIESDGSFKLMDHECGHDHEAGDCDRCVHVIEEEAEGFDAEAKAIAGTVITEEDGTMYFCPDDNEEAGTGEECNAESEIGAGEEDDVAEGAGEEDNAGSESGSGEEDDVAEEIEAGEEGDVESEDGTGDDFETASEEEAEGRYYQINPDRYKVIYASEKAGMLTEEGGWITPAYYEGENNQYARYDYFCDNPFGIDRIQYIKDRLHVDDINDADPEDVDYLINFILPYDSWNCNYSLYYQLYVYYKEGTVTDGKIWRCPLCNEEFKIERDCDSYVWIYEDDIKKNICDHFNHCCLRDEDRYWTCEECGETYELGSSVFFGRFRKWDEIGKRCIKDHKEWCADREEGCYHCDICGNDLFHPRNYDGTWDQEYLIYEIGDGYVNSELVENHYRKCRTDKAADQIVEETITEDMNELEQAWYLYKWIIKNVTYDYKDVGYGYFVCLEEDFATKFSGEPAIGTEEFKKLYFVKEGRVYKFFDYTEKELALLAEYGKIYHQEAFGCLVQTDSVCAGNARGYVWLLEKVGISSYYKASRALNHAWVTVKLDGNWYNVDPTHGYFMKSDKSRGFDEVDIYYGYKDDRSVNDNIVEDLRCLDESYDPYYTIAQRYEAMYGEKKPYRPQDSDIDRIGLDGFNGNTVSVDMVIGTRSAYMIVGDKAAINISGYDRSNIYGKGKKARYENGVVYANRKGTYKLMYGGGKNRKTVCSIKIEAPKLRGVTKMKVGTDKKIKLRGTKQAVSYKVEDTAIASVSPSGVVSAKKSGTTTITATVAGHSYTGTIIVK